MLNPHIALLTGLPRSGTNLTCTLLNKVPDTVALSEPMDVQRLGNAASPDKACDQIEQFGLAQRESLLARRMAVTKHRNGRVLDNFFADERGEDGLRHSESSTGAARFDKPLTADFLLVVKHPAAFSALLPAAVQRFRCFALIRNPLSILASWNAIRIAVRDGHAPAAERIDHGLAGRLAGLPDRLDRQLELLGWFFSRFRSHLDPRHVIRYEDLIATGGAALSCVSRHAASLAEDLRDRNRNPVYDWSAMAPVAQRLLRSDGDYWSYYSRDDVEGLLAGSAA